MLLPEALEKLTGWPLVPVAPKGKRPIADNWESGLSDKALLRIAREKPLANVGVLARSRPGLDIDVTDSACADAIQFCAELELGAAPVRVGLAPKRLLVYRTGTPFRKVKAFLRAPDGSLKGADGKDFAVEFLGDGQFYVVEGIHPDTGSPYKWDSEAWWESPLEEVDEARVRAFFAVLPDYLPTGWQVVRVTGAVNRPDDADDDLLSLAQQPLDGWDENRVIDDILPYLDLDCHYDDWVKVGQALHHQFEGSDEGFDLWDAMFQGSSKYTGPEYGRERWDSFGGRRGRQVTLATLIHETKSARDEARVASSAASVSSLRDRVAQASTLASLEVEISRDARKTKMLEVDREGLAVAIRDRVRELGGQIPIGTVRGWVRAARETRDLEVGGEGMPDWARQWVFCSNGDKFFSLKNKHLVTSYGFRAIHNRLMPVGDDGERARSDQACLEAWNMPVVDNLAYVPWAGPVFEMNGCTWGNLYRDDLVPEIPVEMSAADLAAVDVVMKHAEVMFPDERERGLLLSWCAWQVQNPGVKVRWAPYLFGIEGDGKSFWAGLVGAAMGQVNVRSVTAKVLESPFTDWAVGAAVIVLEEMKQHGHNRYDVMNALKPLITNDVAEIHPKGRAPYMAPNTANYLLLSNYMDGAPVTDTDRRYLFLRSAVKLPQVREMDAGGYFGRLFGVVQDRPGAIRSWLLGYSLHPDFAANGRAPDTKVREAVIESVKSEMDSLVEDVLEDEGFGETLVFGDLVTALKLAGAPQFSDKHVGVILGKKGYSYIGRVQVAGKRKRVWSQVLEGVEGAKQWFSGQNV
jgi:hypothetical protein